MNIVVNNYNIIEILLVTFLISFSLGFIAKKVAVHINALDMPNERKIHKTAMPRLGGLAIFGSFLFGYIVYGSISTQMLSILIASFILFVLGIIDDIKSVRAKYKIIVHFLVAAIVVFYGGLYFTKLNLLGLHFVFPLIVNKGLSMLFIVGAINAINLIDGLDGLCTGISAIYFITIAIIAYVMNMMQGLDVILCLIMIGSTLGFLVHNFPPAKIFLGDCGSTFLGFMIAVVAMLGYKGATLTSLAVPIVILAIPIFDTLFAILRRVIHHRKISAPDKEHFHHQLLNMRFSQKKTVLIIYAINILFSAVSIFYVLGDNKIALVIYIILMTMLLYIVVNTDILFERKKRRKLGRKNG